MYLFLQTIMLSAIILLIIGFVLLLGGGHLLVQGAASLARTLGVSSLVIGLTVVAFGTSAPELAVNVQAVISGNGGISFGNIVGSNIANIGLVIGCAALVRPLDIQGVIISREIPMMLLACLAAIIMAGDRLLTGSAVDQFSRADGLLLGLLFSVFLYYTAAEVLGKRCADPLVRQAAAEAHDSGLRVIGKDALRVAGGFAALVGGGRLSVKGATGIAQWFGVPEVVIGLTVVAVGTSLPELVTSVMAAWKGETDLAVGNVVGSNIFNLLFVGGVCATVGSIPVPAGGMHDLLVMSFFSAILLPLSITDQRRITRWEGMALLVCYVGYTTWRIMTVIPRP